MGLGIGFLCSFVILLALSISPTHADPLVPSLCIFGDSVVAAGNNNNLDTLVKANFPPYGRDFANRSPTGRFCNGKLRNSNKTRSEDEPRFARRSKGEKREPRTSDEKVVEAYAEDTHPGAIPASALKASDQMAGQTFNDVRQIHDKGVVRIVHWDRLGKM